MRETIIINPTLGFTLGSSSQAISISETTTQRTLVRVLHRDADSATLANTGTHLRHTFLITSTRDIGTTYTYNDRGLLHTATARFPGSDRTFEYHYDYNLAGGLHVGTGDGTASSIPFAVESPIHTVIRAYDTTRHALRSIENHVDNTLVSGYAYQVNEIGQRTSVTTTGDEFDVAPADWTWGHDALGQIVSAKHEDDGGHSRFYNYDFMGNRIASRTGTHTASGGAATTYGRDNLNQYTEIDPPTADAFEPGYDDDGNLTAGPLPVAKDQLNTLEWDGRNQLIRVHEGTGSGKELLASYTYDAYGRRMIKTDAQGSQRDYFLYDGWNLIAEYRGAVHNSGNPPTLTLRRTWSWGLDLSGTLQGAGGVGGMLATRNTDGNVYYPTYDGNGNVSEYVEYQADTDPEEEGDQPGAVVVAHFEYDPYGNLTAFTEATPGLAATFAYRFSTKPVDPATGLYYYGYRWYDPLTGRWPSRDPIGERGGVNLYGFVGNDGVDSWDILGKKISWVPTPGADKARAADCWVKFKQHLKDTVGQDIFDKLDHNAGWNVIVTIGFGTWKTDTRHQVPLVDGVKIVNINWDCCFGVRESEQVAISPATALGHELGHALALLEDEKALKGRRDAKDPNYEDMEERRVITEIEHDIARRHGEGLRKTHGGGRAFPTTSPDTTQLDPKGPEYPKPPLPQSPRSPVPPPYILPPGIY